MNFLAHLALSGSHEEILIGNAIADFTRRKYYADFSEGIQKGIALHHFIDEYTDDHPVVKEMLEQWRPRQGKYAGVVNDIVMDHFLAQNFVEYHHQDLANFASNSYALFRKYWAQIPERAQHTFRYMESGNWLLQYQFEVGMERSLSGMSRRAQNQNGMAEAVQQLRNEKAFFEERFRVFYPELMAAVELRQAQLDQKD